MSHRSDMDIRRFLPISIAKREDCSSTAEYVSRISLELNLNENRTAAMELLAQDTRSRCFRVSVEGYDTSLPADEVKAALIKKFGYFCGGVADIVVPRDPLTSRVNRCGFVYLRGEEEQLNRALALDGGDFGGWVATIRSSPGERECELDELDAVALRTLYYRKERSTAVWVEGYDIRRPEEEVKSELIKHFSSCGMITDLFLFPDPLTRTLSSFALVYFYEPREVSKALSLSGSYAGGWRVHCKLLPEPDKYPPHPEDEDEDEDLYEC